MEWFNNKNQMVWKGLIIMTLEQIKELEDMAIQNYGFENEITIAIFTATQMMRKRLVKGD